MITQVLSDRGEEGHEHRKRRSSGMCVGGEPDVDYKLKVECRTAVQNFANQNSTSALNDANQTSPRREGGELGVPKRPYRVA